MDIVSILIVIFIVMLVICESKGYHEKKSKNKVEEFTYHKKMKNFYNFQRVDEKPPMPSPYQCVLKFNCSQQQPSDKYGNVCKKCTGGDYPDNLVMARDVGKVRQISRLW